MNTRHLQLCASDEWAETVEQHMLPWVLDGIHLGARVLEIGPGPGRTTEVIARLAPRLLAVEIDRRLAGALANRLPAQVAIVQGDATALPVRTDHFTAALCLTMLHHVPSPGRQDALFREAARVLRPGAIFAGQDSLDSPELRDLHEDDVYVPVDPATLRPRLEDAGFTRVEVDTNPYAVRFRARR